MPLMHKASKKALEHNIKAEMEAHPGKERRAQNLAIAYDVQRHAKKMAKGGPGSGVKGHQISKKHQPHPDYVEMLVRERGHESDEKMHAQAKKYEEQAERASHPDAKAEYIRSANAFREAVKKRRSFKEGGLVSAKTEKRPMPDQKGADSAMVMRNDHKRPNGQDGWTDQPTVKQAQHKPKVERISAPRMVPSSVMNTKLHNQEDDLMKMKPASPKEEPAKMYNEEHEAITSASPDMAKPHNKINKRPHLAEGGMINNKVSMHSAEEDMVEHPAHLEEDDDQEGPSEHEFMADHMEMLAEGGEIAHEMDEQPEDEEDIEHHASIVAAIMAKRRAMEELHSGSEDEDHAEMMAEGGTLAGRRHTSIPSHESIYTHEDVDTSDLSRNADEDANEEDQLSFNAIKKENYSESDALDETDHPMDSNLHGDEREEMAENKHDSRIVSAIRSKMKKRSPIVR